MSADIETPTPREETPKQRIDRELNELNDELRILLPGVQLVFGFLLAAPFSSRFDDLGSDERASYMLAFASAAAASVVLMGPVAHHRLRFRRGDKERLLRRANHVALVALVLIGLSLAASAYLVFAFVESTAAGIIAATAIVLVATWMWFGRVLR